MAATPRRLAQYDALFLSISLSWIRFDTSGEIQIDNLPLSLLLFDAQTTVVNYQNAHPPFKDPKAQYRASAHPCIAAHGVWASRRRFSQPGRCADRRP